MPHRVLATPGGDLAMSRWGAATTSAQRAPPHKGDANLIKAPRQPKTTQLEHNNKTRNRETTMNNNHKKLSLRCPCYLLPSARPHVSFLADRRN